MSKCVICRKTGKLIATSYHRIINLEGQFVKFVDIFGNQRVLPQSKFDKKFVIKEKVF